MDIRIEAFVDVATGEVVVRQLTSEELDAQPGPDEPMGPA